MGKEGDEICCCGLKGNNIDDVAEISSRRRPKSLTNFSILSNSRTFPTWYQKKKRIANGRETKRLQLSFVAIQVTFFPFIIMYVIVMRKLCVMTVLFMKEKGSSPPASGSVFVHSFFCSSTARKVTTASLNFWYFSGTTKVCYARKLITHAEYHETAAAIESL